MRNLITRLQRVLQVVTVWHEYLRTVEHATVYNNSLEVLWSTG